MAFWPGEPCNESGDRLVSRNPVVIGCGDRRLPILAADACRSSAVNTPGGPTPGWILAGGGPRRRRLCPGLAPLQLPLPLPPRRIDSGKAPAGRSHPLYGPPYLYLRGGQSPPACPTSRWVHACAEGIALVHPCRSPSPGRFWSHCRGNEEGRGRWPTLCTLGCAALCPGPLLPPNIQRYPS